MSRVLAERLEPLEATRHRADEVDDFLDVGAQRLIAGLSIEHVEQRGLGALDPSGGDGLTPKVRPDEQTRMRQRPPAPGQSPQRRLGVGNS